MAKRAAAAASAPEADPKEEQAPKKRVQASVDGAFPFVPAHYHSPRHFSRVMAQRGGPWAETVVAISEADAFLSGILQKGFDLLKAEHRGVVTDGIFMSWLLAKPKGHEGQGFTEIKHITRTIKGNLGTLPPALSTQGADDLLEGLFADGYRLFNVEIVTVDMNGQGMLWVLVR